MFKIFQQTGNINDYAGNIGYPDVAVTDVYWGHSASDQQWAQVSISHFAAQARLWEMSMCCILHNSFHLFPYRIQTCQLWEMLPLMHMRLLQMLCCSIWMMIKLMWGHLVLWFLHSFIEKKNWHIWKILILSTFLHPPKVKVWVGFFQRILWAIFSMPNNYYRTLSGHSVCICARTKCFGWLWEYLMVHAR